jgi:hypothetical protein
MYGEHRKQRYCGKEPGGGSITIPQAKIKKLFRKPVQSAPELLINLRRSLGEISL